MTKPNRQQRRAMEKQGISQEPQLTPEQQAQIQNEMEMQQYIEENGIEAMVDLQATMKKADIDAKIPAAGNVKAWFETMSELTGLVEQGVLKKPENITLEEWVTEYNDFKVNIYKEVAMVYSDLTIEQFGKEEDFINPFLDIWEDYANKRDTVESALEELYAWTILQDPIMFASQMNQLVCRHNQQEAATAAE